MSKIDLHIHSAASDDGEYTPQELVAMCTAQGMELIAVTDHNSVRSVTAAQSTASSCGLLVLSGVELDCTHKGRNFHLLGYGFDHTRKEFAQIEQEIAELDDDEKKMFLEDLGLSESGLEKLIRASYSLLGLLSYLTAGEQEVKAWTITKGTKAPQAAGKIHSDFERGFIRAEIVSYDDLMACGTYTNAKEKGLVRLEGKEYVVQDGDIILFRFNV